jgi:hypothetical protein
MLHNLVKWEVVKFLILMLSAYGWLHMIPFFYRFKKAGEINNISLIFSACLLGVAALQIGIGLTMLKKSWFDKIQNRVKEIDDGNKV